MQLWLPFGQVMSYDWLRQVMMPFGQFEITRQSYHNVPRALITFAIGKIIALAKQAHNWSWHGCDFYPEKRTEITSFSVLFLCRYVVLLYRSHPFQSVVLFYEWEVKCIGLYTKILHFHKSLPQCPTLCTKGKQKRCDTAVFVPKIDEFFTNL